MNALKFIRRWSILATTIFCSLSVTSAQDATKLVAADNDFAFDLLKQIAAGQPSKNIFISPFSASSALMMAADGAAGETKAEMTRVLKTDGIDAASLDAGCKSLEASLKAETNAILTLADGIWYQKDYKLKPGFVDDNKKFFNAGLAPVDFKSPASADAINAWAEQQTHGKIHDVAQFPFPPLTRVVLANAIYFKGKWVNPFDKAATHRQDFHPADNNTKQVLMMDQRREFRYQENDAFQAVALPYAGDRLQMYLFLPAKGSTPQALVKDLSGETWSRKVAPAFSSREGELTFPKFKLDYEVTLNDPLQALGMRQAFEPAKADFSAMVAEPVFIGLVKQKSYVAVDEEGTEAAAVTSVRFQAAAIRMPESPFKMLVDRPFFFVIADRQTQAILFMGIVNDPVP